MSPHNKVDTLTSEQNQQIRVAYQSIYEAALSEDEGKCEQTSSELNEDLQSSVEINSVLKDRIDQLPDILINSQLEQIFNQDYLDKVTDSKALARKLVDVALANGDFENLEQAAPESAIVDIEFSLSPISGLRLFAQLSEIEQFDRVFAHFRSPTDYPNLMVRWQHKESGEILYFSPLLLPSDKRDYISLNPDRGWLPGSYQVSLYDLDNSQQLVGSNDYFIDTVIEAEHDDSQLDRDVINDLISNGLAVPKAY